MSNYRINNIVFDIGNVLMRWEPQKVVERIFQDRENSCDLTKNIFRSDSWHDLNRGKITENDLILYYSQTLQISIDNLKLLMDESKNSLEPIKEMFNLVENLYNKGYNLLLLTDNTKEILCYLKSKYNFWRFFRGIVSSSDVGHLKPSPIIYQTLLNTYNISPKETVFIDDLLINIDGAKFVGMHAIHFSTASKCENELRKLGIQWRD